MNYLDEMSDVYIKAAIGEHVHVPLNLIFQGIGEEDKVAGVFQFKADPKLIKALTAGANLDNHVLWLGDGFLRPKIVCESRHLMGCGIAGIYTSGFTDIEGWVEHGKILKGKLDS